jgi:SRSO17 transposase
MIVKIPASLERFCETIHSGLTAGQRKVLPVILAGILLCGGRRSLAGLGRAVVTERRNRASLSKLLRRNRFRTRDLYDEAAQRMIEAQPVAGSGRRLWFLVLDGVATKRGGFTQIENARQYKVSRRTKKSGTPSTKSHTFVMGLLLTDRGVRIPLARRTWRTKEYCRTHKKKFLKQTELAQVMIRSLRLPMGVDLIVLADGYFEGTWLHEVCTELGYTYIAPASSSRCFANGKGKSNGQSLHARGRGLPPRGLEKRTLVQGSEDTARYRRYVQRKHGAQRRYRFSHEVQAVAGLGPTGIVYSWKSPSFRPRRDDRTESFKVLLTNHLELTGAQIIEYYELRWQIELWFRELKSHLGLADYTGTDFAAFERHIDLVLLGFLFLEQHRLDLIRAAGSRRRSGELAAMRITALKQELAAEAAEGDLAYLSRLLRSPEGRETVLQLYAQMRKVA